MESELEHLYVRIVWEIITMRSFLWTLVVAGNTKQVQQQGYRLLEACGRYVALIEDHRLGNPPSTATVQRRNKEQSYLIQKWKRVCAE